MIDDNATRGNYSRTIYIGQYFCIFLYYFSVLLSRIIIPYYYYSCSPAVLWTFILALPFYLDPSQRSSVLSSPSYLAISTTQHPVCRPCSLPPSALLSSLGFTYQAFLLIPWYQIILGYYLGVQGVLGALGGTGAPRGYKGYWGYKGHWGY